MDDREDELRKLAGDLAEAASGGDARAGETLEHVERYLGSDEPEGHEDLTDRLSEAVRHFEADHPELAATIQAVVNSLTASGI